MPKKKPAVTLGFTFSPPQPKLVLLLLLAFTARTGWSMQRAQGFCEQGGAQILNTQPLVQKSVPRCQVNVYLTHTLTLATIYADNSATPLSNPFNADGFGHWFFYAANGRYDVTFSITPVSSGFPWTIGDVLLNDGGGGGGGGTGTVTSVGLTVPSWLTVTGSPVITAGIIAIAPTTGQGAHQVIGTGTGSAFGPMTLGTGDLPFTYSGNTTVLATVTGAVTSTHLAVWDASGNLKDGGAPAGGGTVTSVTFTGDGTVLSSTPSSAVTTSGTLTASLASFAAHSVLGNFTGSPATPTVSTLTTAMLPFTYSGSTTVLATTTGTLTNGRCVQIDASGNLVQASGACSVAAGTVTSVALTVPSWLTVSGSPVTSAGTLAVTPASAQTSHQVIGTGSGTTYGPVTLGTGDLPFTYSGNTTKLATTTGTLTNGHCVSIDANGNIVDNGGTCGTGAGGGTVTSVALSAPTGFTITGSPVVTAGTLAFVMPASWGTGSLLLGNGAASVTTLTIGGNNTCLTSNGTTASWVACAATGGTVTSVGLSFPGFTVTNSPVTGSGTLTIANPLTTEGDIPYFAGTAWTRLGVGTSGQCLKSNGTDPGWGACGAGTVTSVGLTAPTGFIVTSSPVVASGNISLAMPSGWIAGDLLLGNGANSVTRLPIGSNGLYLQSNGTTAIWAGAGSVTSVGLTMPPQFSVASTPITAAGTIGVTWNTIGPHLWLGNNTAGSANPAALAIGVPDLPFTYTGSTTKLATSTGTLTNGHCVSIDASGNLVDSGTVGCGGGGGGTPLWNAILNPTNTFNPSMAGNLTEFDFSSGLNHAFQWYNTVAATSGASQSGPILDLSCGNEWHAAASTKGCASIQFIPGTGTDAASTIALTHFGAATGTVTTITPGPIQAGPAGAVGGGFSVPEGTAISATAAFDACYGDSTVHGLLCSWNNGSFFPIPQRIASGTAALGTGAINSATCATVVTVSATGVATTDTISAGFNGDPTGITGYIPATAGMLTIIAYPTSGNVNFKVCNNTTSSVTPGAVTLNWIVTR